MWAPPRWRMPGINIPLIYWTFIFLLLLHSTNAALNNKPPRFLIDGQTEIVLRLKEGSATPVGKNLYCITYH